MPLSILSLYETARSSRPMLVTRGEDPGQLGDLGHVGLAEEGRLVGVEAEGEVVEGDVARVLGAGGVGVLDGGQRRGSRR